MTTNNEDNEIVIRHAVPGDEDGIARVHVTSWKTTYAGLDTNPTRKFYERIGGQLMSDTKVLEIDGYPCLEVGYLWPKLEAHTYPERGN